MIEEERRKREICSAFLRGKMLVTHGITLNIVTDKKVEKNYNINRERFLCRQLRENDSLGENNLTNVILPNCYGNNYDGKEITKYVHVKRCKNFI